jgi:hypothetical protein
VKRRVALRGEHLRENRLADPDTDQSERSRKREPRGYEPPAVLRSAGLPVRHRLHRTEGAGPAHHLYNGLDRRQLTPPRSAERSGDQDSRDEIDGQRERVEAERRRYVAAKR